MLQDKKLIQLWLLYLINLLACSSCVNTKKTTAVWVYKGQDYYQRIPYTLGSGTDTLVKKKLVKGVRAKVSTDRDNKEYVFTSFLVRMDSNEQVIYKREINGSEPTPVKITFFPLDTVTTKFWHGMTASAAFRYLEIKPVYQALTIPFKIRPKLNDSTKSAASNSFNVGITAGVKFTHNVYRKIYYEDSGKKTFSNHYTKKISLSPGLFIGPAVIDLKASNTNNIVKKDRSVPGLTTGAFIVLGFNELNFGMSMGWDIGLDNTSKNWMYNKKPWIGFVLAIDIIK